MRRKEYLPWRKKRGEKGVKSVEVKECCSGISSMSVTAGATEEKTNKGQGNQGSRHKEGNKSICPVPH